MSSENQFQLLKQKKFLPFFLTQGFGALNDNIYKNALLLTIAFSSTDALGVNVGILANVASILFIAPFFLLSPLFGQLADKHEKSRSIRFIKLSEIVIVLIAIVALQVQNIYFLMFILFLLGVQSAAFGPIKYSILPQQLSRAELTGGNGLVETGTFLAILLGTLLGGMLVSQNSNDTYALSAVLLFVAGAGFVSSLRIPLSPAPAKNLVIDWNPFRQIAKTFGYVREQKAILQSIFGISWFWFYGSVLLTQIPNYTRTTLRGDESVTTIILMAFSIGVGIGSMLCNKLSKGRIEPGLVPIGAIGLSFFTFHLFAANPVIGQGAELGASQFINSWANIRILIDIAMVGFSGGIYVVPLYAIIQNRAKPHQLSQVISGSNILDALFIVASGLFAIVLITLELSVPEIFLVTAIANIVVALYIFKQVPEFIFRLVAWLCARFWFNVDYQQLTTIPKEGPCALVCQSNRLSKGLVLAACLDRNATFVFVQKATPPSLLKYLFLASGASIVTTGSRSQLDSLLGDMRKAYSRGNIVCLFHSPNTHDDLGLADLSCKLEAHLSKLKYPTIPVRITSVVHDKRPFDSDQVPLPSFLSGHIQLVVD